MKKYTISFISGDGIGPEVVNSAISCIDAVSHRFNFSIKWEKMPAGEEALNEYGSLLPEETLTSIKKNKVALKGPITTPLGKGFRSVNVDLRKKLELFANLRPSKNIPGVKSRFSNVNLIVIRENTEDLYSGIEFKDTSQLSKKLIHLVENNSSLKIPKGSAIALKTISKSATKRIAEFAFSYAQKNKRKKITIIHKSNILKYTDGLFVSESENVSKKFNSIICDNLVVDNACSKLVSRPEFFDILLCPNLYGDIISDLCSGLVGGLGVSPSANIGNKAAVFEPVHGSAPKHSGLNDVNPSAAILSGAMLLNHLNQTAASKALELAVYSVLKEKTHVTYDINPKAPASTIEMTNAIIQKIKKVKK